jgi:Asp-tRNA(Asn)/Glu-tRNA(Gln) amidotransferase A subunit family amidase
MANSRREFLTRSSLGLLAAAALAKESPELAAQTPQPKQAAPPPGMPPAFGTSAPVGPAVNAATFAEAEKLQQVSFPHAQLEEAASNWQVSMAAMFERRTGPRKVALGADDAPATLWRPELAAGEHVADHNVEPVPIPVNLVPRLPAADEDIAFAPAWQLAGWVRTKQLTSERLTQIYLARLKRFDPQLKCVITLCEDHALEQARRADAEIAAGHYRGPLHGIPWGAKDLLDTASIRTTWGAEFLRDRVPAADATVTRLLNDAGAVLVAKLSLGALALNDIWFGGQTKNPWNLDEGASGSSAGPGAAVAAGLVGFAIGSETQGSIISPSMRCGVTGLRPTFGRVPRTGAMTLSWTCDKLGVMARGVEDTLMVLQLITACDPRDTGSVPMPSSAPRQKPLGAIRVGYVEKWTAEASDVDRHALDTVKKLGMQAVPVTLPDLPYDSLNVILMAEAGAAFEAETLEGRVDQLAMQVPDAWPNTFRQARFLSAVDLVQADRLRRRVAVEMAKIFEHIDLLLVPSLRDEPMVIFNFTGHPSLTLRAGFVEVSEERSDWAPDPKHPYRKFSPPRRVPHGVTLVGPLFGELLLTHAGSALERELRVASERPKGF